MSNCLLMFPRNGNAPGVLFVFDVDEGLAAPFPQTGGGVLDQLPDIEIKKVEAPPPEYDQPRGSEAGTSIMSSSSSSHQAEEPGLAQSVPE